MTETLDSRQPDRLCWLIIHPGDLTQAVAALVAVSIEMQAIKPYRIGRLSALAMAVLPGHKQAARDQLRAASLPCVFSNSGASRVMNWRIAQRIGLTRRRRDAAGRWEGR